MPYRTMSVRAVARDGDRADDWRSKGALRPPVRDLTMADVKVIGVRRAPPGPDSSPSPPAEFRRSAVPGHARFLTIPTQGGP